MECPLALAGTPWRSWWIWGDVVWINSFLCATLGRISPNQDPSVQMARNDLWCAPVMLKHLLVVWNWQIFVLQSALFTNGGFDKTKSDATNWTRSGKVTLPHWIMFSGQWISQKTQLSIPGHGSWTFAEAIGTPSWDTFRFFYSNCHFRRHLNGRQHCVKHLLVVGVIDLSKPKRPCRDLGNLPVTHKVSVLRMFHFKRRWLASRCYWGGEGGPEERQVVKL